MAHHNATLGCLLANGFPMVMATHAFSAIDAYVYGFVLTEQTVPFEAGGAEEFVAGVEQLIPAEQYPHLSAMLHEQVLGHGYEFDFGLDLILDGLERRLDTS